MSAFRALRQVTRVSARTGFNTAARSAAVLRPAATRQIAAATRTFSVSALRFGSGSTDVSLAQKLQQELEYETTENAASSTPEFVKELTSQGVWSVEDVPGQDEVALTRKFGQETIRLIFSIADIQSEPEDLEAAEGEEAEQSTADYPIRVSVSITKANAPGALNIDAVVQEGQFITENMSFYDDAKVGTELTAEADWKRRGMYIGPEFDTLDLGLQEEIDKFLQERGINESIALFIPEYAEFKEQNEYVKWLQKVKNFVEV
ncbi:regulatory protein suaprga1 [Ephemerocybe angulata]|uniref:Regulatory protein suaprga1 n=1 Tax=Ephemerocybe angulata TaxID=980116 RepID=A0A8H6IIE9_9AGAR|nr:regulatory protein suaprga1 [Tulosesus angulatus]